MGVGLSSIHCKHIVKTAKSVYINKNVYNNNNAVYSYARIKYYNNTYKGSKSTTETSIQGINHILNYNNLM